MNRQIFEFWKQWNFTKKFSMESADSLSPSFGGGGKNSQNFDHVVYGWPQWIPFLFTVGRDHLQSKTALKSWRSSWQDVGTKMHEFDQLWEKLCKKCNLFNNFFLELTIPYFQVSELFTFFNCAFIFNNVNSISRQGCIK